MKPRTKIEKRCWELQSQLPEPTIKQFEWARAHLPQVGYYRSRKNAAGVYRCTECGHEWEGEYHGENVICPNCEAHLKVEVCKKKRAGKNGYYCSISAIEEWTVFRYFWFEQYCSAQGEVWGQSIEVMQLWNDQKGHEVCIARNKLMNAGYSTQIFSLYSPMSIKHPEKSREYYYGIDIRNLGCFDVYIIDLPGKYKYINWKGLEEFDKLFILRVFGQHPMVETLMKSGYVNLMWRMARQDLFEEKNVDREMFINAARLVVKNKYQFKDIGGMDTWIDYIHQLKQLEKDWHNPSIVCPKDLDEKHRQYNAQLNKRRDAQRKKEELERNKKQQTRYVANRKKYFDLLIEGEQGLKIKVLRSIEDFYDEGAEMKHCVYNMGYYNLRNHPHSLILSARLGDVWEAPDKYVETLEIDLRNFTIVQCHGHCNQNSEMHDIILKLVRDNMYQIKALSMGKAA